MSQEKLISLTILSKERDKRSFRFNDIIEFPPSKVDKKFYDFDICLLL